ncbi:MAG: hypothetical protein J6T55_01170 [Alphaproteobacteria bacterium]|nr:hypothetical protein [Alphaproteobacteria bacterium]
MKKIALISLFLLGGCYFVQGDDRQGQKLFYWERPNTGVAWFAKDHRECMLEADKWPFEWPGWPGRPEELKLRFDNNSENGIWAQFIPYPGAMPVHVNYVSGDWSVDYDDYQKCMERRHYTQRKPAQVNYQVFPQ